MNRRLFVVTSAAMHCARRERDRADGVDREIARSTRCERLMAEAAPAVRGHARTILMQVRIHMEQQELEAIGTLKALELVDAFEEGRGIPFKEFIRRAVYGAMWEPLRRKNLREASHAEINPQVMEVPENRQGPEEMLSIALRSELALEALASLDPRERFVAQAYYAGHDLGAIGRAIGIGESGASRVHVSALRHMKTYFRLRGRTAA